MVGTGEPVTATENFAVVPRGNTWLSGCVVIFGADVDVVVLLGVLVEEVVELYFATLLYAEVVVALKARTRYQ